MVIHLEEQSHTRIKHRSSELKFSAMSKVLEYMSSENQHLCIVTLVQCTTSIIHIIFCLGWNISQGWGWELRLKTLSIGQYHIFAIEIKSIPKEPHIQRC